MFENSSAEFRKFIENVLDEIDVPQSRYDQAVERYQSVGRWLDREGSSVAHYNPDIYPQGSFRLGTVIKPPIGEDYDIDLVCSLNLTKSVTTQKDLKRRIGDEITAYATANGMNSRPTEGSRCWTLHYADGAQFHLDVLPALPDAGSFRGLLTAKHAQADWSEHAIAITDRNHPEYARTSQDWLQSNPKGYANWFEGRTAVELRMQKQRLVEAKVVAKVDDVPTWRVKTPLQRVIQLLKKHRDEMFLDDADVKPISIIITTLAARAYQNDADIIAALRRIVPSLEPLIENRGGISWVPNPVNPLENFADKWVDYPERKEAFYAWAKKLREDLLAAAGFGNPEQIGERLNEAFGSNTVEEVLKKRYQKNIVAPKHVVLANSATHKQRPPWPMANRGVVRIKAAKKFGRTTVGIKNDGTPLQKNTNLRFTADTNVAPPFAVEWQIVNTGSEAERKGDLRGGFESSSHDRQGFYKSEHTKYAGKHWVQCFIIKDGVCVAVSEEFFVNIV